MCVVGVSKELYVVDGLDKSNILQQVKEQAAGTHILLTGKSGRTWGAALLPDARAAADRAVAPCSKPVYVSVGHRVSLETCIRIVNMCCVSARLPEPVLLAIIRSRNQISRALS